MTGAYTHFSKVVLDFQVRCEGLGVASSENEDNWLRKFFNADAEDFRYKRLPGPFGKAGRFVLLHSQNGVQEQHTPPGPLGQIAIAGNGTVFLFAEWQICQTLERRADQAFILDFRDGRAGRESV